MPLFHRLFAATLIAVVASGFMIGWRAMPGASVPIARLDDTLYDSLYQFRPFEDRRDSDVVIVALDQESLNRMDEAAEKAAKQVPPPEDPYVAGWPWPRAYWGSAAEYLIEDCHAKAVVFDILFSEANVRMGKEGKSDDQRFAEALGRAREASPKALVFGSVVEPDGKLGRFRPPLIPPPTFGAANTSDGQAWRNYLPTVFGVPSLAARGAQAAGGEPKIRVDRPFRLHYYGPHETPDGRNTFRYVSAASVVFVSFGDDESKWHIDKEMFRDKIVMVGLIAAGTYDVKSTPLSGKCPGVEIQATAIENLLHGDQVRPLGAISTGACDASHVLAGIGGSGVLSTGLDEGDCGVWGDRGVGARRGGDVRATRYPVAALGRAAFGGDRGDDRRVRMELLRRGPAAAATAQGALERRFPDDRRRTCP